MRRRSGCRPLFLLVVLCEAGACSWRQAPAPTTLVLVTVDTLRADHLGAYGDGRGLTPHLDRLARQSQVFDLAYAPCTFTLPSVSALLTSRYPEELGVVDNSTRLPETATTMGAHLAGHGWLAGAVVSNYVLRREHGLDRGFAHYDDTLPGFEAVRPVPERRADDTTDAALQVLDQLRTEGARQFLWVHYQDPHGPYDPPADLRARYLEAQRASADGRRTLPRSETQSGLGAIPRYQFFDGQHEVAYYRAGYAGEVSALDAAVGRLLAGLRQRGLEESAVVAFAADHGESLGENGLWFTHGEDLSDAQARVPLCFRAPALRPGRRSDVASLLDVFPSLASLVGVPPPPQAQGRDLFSPGATQVSSAVYLASLKEAPVRRYGLIWEGHKYVVSLAGGSVQEELSLAGDDASPPSDDARRLAMMRSGLEAFRAGLALGTRVEKGTLTPEERASLEALGYLDPSEDE